MTVLPKLKVGLLAAACAIAATGFQPTAVEASEITPVAKATREAHRPNVLLIFADDLGYADMGFQSQSKDVVTPHLDRLAAEGAIMSAGYVTASVCGPSRAGMLTGRYQQRFGYHDNVAPYVLEEGVEPGLPVELSTMGDYFKGAGYRTGLVGKWHDGDQQKFWPHNRGFEEVFGFNNGAANYEIGPINQQEQRTRPWESMYRNGKLVDDFDDYLTDRFGTEAVNYIEKHKDEPFFLYVAFNAVHGPLQAKKEDLERFSHIKDEKRRILLAMNYNMDQNVGRILDKVEELGLMEDTLVFFLSDNGGKPADNHSYNTPLRGEKGTYWEGGIRIPYTVTWKGTIPAGQVLSEPVSSLDILTTSLAATNTDVKDEWKLEGVNLLPYLKGESSKLDDRFLFWDTNMSMAIRDGAWKLIRENKFDANKKPQLFNISQDIKEQHNVIDQYPEVAKRLQSAHDEWRQGNKPQQWGWSKREFPVSTGWRGHQ